MYYDISKMICNILYILSSSLVKSFYKKFRQQQSIAKNAQTYNKKV